MCCNCFGIITLLAPLLPSNRGGKRVTEAYSTATLPSFCTVGGYRASRCTSANFVMPL